jgi:hypothetical protein
MNKNMSEKISSSMTVYYKVLLPVLWIAGFGFGTATMWLGKFDQPSQAQTEPKYMFLIFFIVGSAFLLRDLVRLKTITIENDELIIRNFTKVIRVPVRQINRITESRFMRPKTISLTILPSCEFGEKITFIPKAKMERTFKVLTEHPIAKRLRELAGIKGPKDA